MLKHGLFALFFLLPQIVFSDSNCINQLKSEMLIGPIACGYLSSDVKYMHDFKITFSSAHQFSFEGNLVYEESPSKNNWRTEAFSLDAVLAASPFSPEEKRTQTPEFHLKKNSYIRYLESEIVRLNHAESFLTHSEYRCSFTDDQKAALSCINELFTAFRDTLIDLKNSLN